MKQNIAELAQYRGILSLNIFLYSPGIIQGYRPNEGNQRQKWPEKLYNAKNALYYTEMDLICFCNVY